MDMLKAILHRRSVRIYTEERMPEEKLNAILYAGLSAASSKKHKSGTEDTTCNIFLCESISFTSYQTKNNKNRLNRDSIITQIPQVP